MNNEAPNCPRSVLDKVLEQQSSNNSLTHTVINSETAPQGFRVDMFYFAALTI